MDQPATTLHAAQHTRGVSRRSRLASIDLIRGISVFLMIIIHVMDFYGEDSIHQSLFGTALKFAIGWPAASVFVFVMGVFITYSNKQSLSQGLQRALWLFALGYILNFARGTAPLWLSLQLGLVSHEALDGFTPLDEFLIVNILQFAGLALAICVLIKHFLPHPYFWVIGSLLIMFGSPFAWDLSFNNAAIDEFYKLVGGHSAQGAMFPLLPWLAYPFAGMAFGYYLAKNERGSNTFTKGLHLGLALIAFGAIVISTNPNFHVADNLRSGPGLILLIMGCILCALRGCALLENAISSSKILNLFCYWGKHVTLIYVVQWVLIGWGLMIFGLQQMNLIFTLIAMAGFLVLSHYTTQALLKLKPTSKNQ